MTHHTAPRLYYPLNLTEIMVLPEDQSHYLTSVMRLQRNDAVRLFNAQQGEFLYHIETPHKKSTSIRQMQQLRVPEIDSIKRLYFAPLKKERTEWLVEKATELGVSDLIPVITDHTDALDIKTLKIERLQGHIIKAVEQCERLSCPTLHAPIKLYDLYKATDPIYTAIERVDLSPATHASQSPINILIGAPGGWSAAEKEKLLALDHIIPVSLGTRILRAETAAIVMLSQIGF
jgi:16S rRNA (uracil1498-N3)-methyltransferase